MASNPIGTYIDSQVPMLWHMVSAVAHSFYDRSEEELLKFGGTREYTHLSSLWGYLADQGQRENGKEILANVLHTYWYEGMEKANTPQYIVMFTYRVNG